MVIAIPRICFMMESKQNYDYSSFEPEIKHLDSLQAIAKAEQDSIHPKWSLKSIPELADTIELKLFPFNPNQLPDSSWQKLGLKLWQIKTIKNYESKGGTFKTKEDVRKMNSIPDSQYVLLEPYILIPETEMKPVWKKKEWEPGESRFKKKNVIVELNTTDSLALLELKGIGPWFAFKILNYRKRLGGFMSKEQLYEIKGIDSVLFEKISPQIMIDIFEVNKINVNTAKMEELKSHPYIGWDLSRMIINYRIQHGSYNSLFEIKNLPLVDDELYSKLAPYLTVK